MELGAIVLPIVAIVEFGLAALILAAAGSRARPFFAAVILLANGLEALILWRGDLARPLDSSYNVIVDLRSLGLSGVPVHRAFVFLDTLIAMSVAMLLAWTPRRPRFPRFLLGAWAGLSGILLAWVVHPTLGAGWSGIEGNEGYLFLRAYLPWMSWLLAAALLALGAWPATRAMPPGPGRTHALLVMVGVAIPLFWQFGLGGVGRLSHLVAGSLVMPTGWDDYVRLVLAPLLTHWFLLVFAVALVLHGIRHGSDRWAALTVAAAAVLGLTRGIQVFLPGFWFPDNAQELLSQSIRPAFLAAAFLRFDLVRLPRPWTRPVAGAAVGLAATGIVCLTLATVTGEGLAATDITIGEGMVAATVVAGFGWTVARPAMRAFRRVDAGDDDLRGRLDRFRLALEQDDPDKEALRRELRISAAEAAAVEVLLKGRLMVPREAVRGLKEGDLLDGRYRVTGPLAEGNQGTVVQADEVATGRRVVVKAVNQAWAADAQRRQQRLLAEARASALAGRMVEVVSAGPLVYLVRDFIPGQTLAKRLEGGPVPADLWRAWTAQLVAQLEVLHAADIVHGDIKPANIIIHPRGEAFLIDEGGCVEGTQVLGSPSWAAPEQWQGILDRSSDLYQLARVIDAMRPPGAPLPSAWQQALSAEPRRRPTLRVLSRTPFLAAP